MNSLESQVLGIDSYGKLQHQHLSAEELRKLRGCPHCKTCGEAILLEQNRSIVDDQCCDCWRFERMERLVNRLISALELAMRQIP